MARLSTLLTVAIGLSGCYAAPGLDCGGGSSVPSVSVPVASVKPGSSASSGRLPSSAASSVVPSGTGSSKAPGTSIVPSGTATSSRPVVPSGTATSSRLPGTSIVPSGSASFTRLPGTSVSGSASSGRPSGASASRSRGPSNGLPNGCADHITTTRTSTRTSFVTVATSTSIQSGFTVTYSPIITVTFTTQATAYVTESPEVTFTYTVQTSTLVIDSTPASVTVTVPTPAGFTPVSCLAAYLDPTVTVTETVSVTQFRFAYQSTLTSTGTAFTAVYSGTTTRTFREATIYTTETSTRSIVRNSPTSTVYEACATNNVVSDGPFGKNFQLPGESEGRLSPGFEVLNPVECCEYCQADPNCLVSSAVTFDQSPATTWVCVPFLRRNDTVTCNPTRQGATLLLQDTPNGLNLTISNSGCGQYLVGESL